jgi:hypothetical protein
MKPGNTVPHAAFTRYSLRVGIGSSGIPGRIGERGHFGNTCPANTWISATRSEAFASDAWTQRCNINRDKNLMRPGLQLDAIGHKDANDRQLPVASTRPVASKRAFGRINSLPNKGLCCCVLRPTD